MVQHVSGNIFESSAIALVNPVSTDGSISTGLDRDFKREFKNNFKRYQEACKTGFLQLGNVLVTEDVSATYGRRLIVNFPTKKSHVDNSSFAYIELCMNSLMSAIIMYKIHDIAVPAIGISEGGLNWWRVRELIRIRIGVFSDVVVYLYDPI
jgi:O-acetyl-ADP-ribose deacetylase (regulator of RNase III)